MRLYLRVLPTPVEITTDLEPAPETPKTRFISKVIKKIAADTEKDIVSLFLILVSGDLETIFFLSKKYHCGPVWAVKLDGYALYRLGIKFTISQHLRSSFGDFCR